MNKKRIIFYFQRGFKFSFQRLYQILYVFLFNPKVHFLNELEHFVKNSDCLEIGGPSNIFKDAGYIPLYPILNVIDNVNFSNSTMWEGAISNENFEIDGHSRGMQYILEANNLISIPDKKYDILISSEVLQHSANTLKTLCEWRRVLKDDGYMVLILPNKDYTFDHRRPVTSLEHIINDYESEIGEDDLTHLNEVLELHDLTRDFECGDFNSFKLRCQNNYEIRGIHHHCFNVELARNILNYANFKVLRHDLFEHRIIILAQVNNI